MTILSKEKSKVLAERNGWSLARAEGYVDGEAIRRRGATPSMYAQIGIDDYCLGFRAAYYERLDLASSVNVPGSPAFRLSFQRSSEAVQQITGAAGVSQEG
jgi:hypothetical protein